MHIRMPTAAGWVIRTNERELLRVGYNMIIQYPALVHNTASIMQAAARAPAKTYCVRRLLPVVLRDTCQR